MLLREINSPRHTDQYSLNPHLICREFPPISPSLHLLSPFYSPSSCSFPAIIFSWQPFFMLPVQAGDLGGDDASRRKRGVTVCVCAQKERVMDKMCWWDREAAVKAPPHNPFCKTSVWLPNRPHDIANSPSCSHLPSSLQAFLTPYLLCITAAPSVLFKLLSEFSCRLNGSLSGCPSAVTAGRGGEPLCFAFVFVWEFYFWIHTVQCVHVIYNTSLWISTRRLSRSMDKKQ